MSNRIVHTGESGVFLRLSLVDEDGTALDVSAVTNKLIYLRAPDGTVAVDNFSYTVSGTDGGLSYQTVSGTIDQTGTWQYQARVTWSTGVSLVSTANTFDAKDPIYP